MLDQFRHGDLAEDHVGRHRHAADSPEQGVTGYRGHHETTGHPGAVHFSMAL